MYRFVVRLVTSFVLIAAAAAEIPSGGRDLLEAPAAITVDGEREIALTAGVSKGDVLLLALEVSGAGEGTVNIRHRTTGWRSLVRLPLESGGATREIRQPFSALWDLPAGDIRFVISGESIRVAHLRLINYEDSRSLGELPHTRFTYEGRSPDAAWRAAAEARIDTYRKAGLRVHVTDAEGTPLSGATVRIRQTRHAFGFGAATTAQMLSADSEDGRRYREIFEKYFNKTVLENDLKWPGWEISKTGEHPAYQRRYTEQALAWLAERNIPVRGHYASWAPIDTRDGNGGGPESDLRERLFAHIREKLPAVGTRVSEWDAVNHIAGWGRTLEDLYGPGIFVDILALVRELAPHAQIWVNEGAILPGGTRQDEYERLIRYLNDHGQPPDGAGMMSHFGLNNLTPPEKIYRRFERFAAFVPRLQLTELDVEAWDDQLQADYQRDVMTMAFSHPAMEGIVMWGFWEGRHWKPDGALWREDWSIKPIGEMWIDQVFDKWWTGERLSTDSHGNAFTRAFHGGYRVEVTANGKSVSTGTTVTRHGRLLHIVCR